MTLADTAAVAVADDGNVGSGKGRVTKLPEAAWINEPPKENTDTEHAA